GGDSSEGVMYSINPDGTGYTLMYEFAGAPGDAGQPYGGLTLLDGVLYGLSSSGGSEGFGALFSDTTGVYDYINDSYGDISLTLDSTDIGDLSQLYYDGKAGQSPDPITVDDLQWSYVSGDLPDQGSHVLGDAYIYDGKYYFYLGSGLEGEGGGGGVPEPSTMLLVLPFLAGLYWMRKRRK
ncbi:PEP-CTERM sorting domain-containing protein, partial [Candidatus Auribacterota bacterium]